MELSGVCIRVIGYTNIRWLEKFGSIDQIKYCDIWSRFDIQRFDQSYVWGIRKGFIFNLIGSDGPIFVGPIDRISLKFNISTSNVEHRIPNHRRYSNLSIFISFGEIHHDQDRDFKNPMARELVITHFKFYFIVTLELNLNYNSLYLQTNNWTSAQYCSLWPRNASAILVGIKDHYEYDPLKINLNLPLNFKFISDR